MAVTFEQVRPADYLTRLAASDLGRGYKALVVAELGIGSGQRVIDLGCGMWLTRRACCGRFAAC